MYKPSTYLEVAYFRTYLLIYKTYFLQNWLSRWNQRLTQLRFIHNWVITDIQWMVRWWVLVHCGHKSDVLHPQKWEWVSNRILHWWVLLGVTLSQKNGPVWTSTHQCTNVDGWCSDRILFSIPVPSQVDTFFVCPFSALISVFFSATLFSPCPLPRFSFPLISIFFFLELYFLPGPHLFF
jgi:hypothetical protein